MTILQDIQRWGASLPAWQQEAITRLFAKDALDEADEDDLYALLKSVHEIPDPKCRQPVTLSLGPVIAPQQVGPLVQIAAIRGLQHVNVLAGNQTMSFARKGLTVIYGDNGSGKSGYARVLKKACRARDQGEPIYPNARFASGKAGKAQAVFDIFVDDVPRTVEWIDGEAAPEELSSIAIFDAHCARDYIDQQGDFSYVPHGMDILSRLAGLCDKLKAKIEEEQRLNHPNTTTVFSHLSDSETSVGRLIAGLSAQTRPADVVERATLSDHEVKRLAQPEKILKEPHPNEKGRFLRLRANRFESLAQQCVEKAAIISDESIGTLRRAVEAANRSEGTARLAARAFKNTPEFLLETGGEAWQALFFAARAFISASYPHKRFSEMVPADPCPLCQQPLADGVARLAAFDAFLNNATESDAREQRAVAVRAFEPITQAQLSIGFDRDIAAEVKEADEALYNACTAFETALTDRVAAIQAAYALNGDWTNIAPLQGNPSDTLLSLVAVLRQEAQALDNVSSEDVRASLEAECNELNARIKLALVKDAVLSAIDQHVLQARLTQCLAAVRTTDISNKAKQLSQTVAFQHIAEALNAEFRPLHVCDLRVSLRSSGVKGQTLYKLALTHPSIRRPILVLSEVEQQTIAIASFLAEVSVSGTRGGIVFDDPVSSLDHQRRGYVAQRLAAETEKRQVVVLTHDLYFLCTLQQATTALGVGMKTLSLNRTENGLGICTDQVPFASAQCAQRVRMLLAMQANIAQAYSAGGANKVASMTRDAYATLRLTWERAVEEVLFSSVVMRFKEGVQAQRLKAVEVLDSDYDAIKNRMTKCSKFMHDTAAQANVPVPSPSELLGDIAAFEAWKNTVEARKKVTRVRRNK